MSYPQSMEHKTCVVIPCYKEAQRIGAVVAGCRRHVPEVLVVDDGSGDGTAEAARLAGATVVEHAVNQGKGMALATGFSWAVDHGFDAVVTLDGDGQHDPDHIASFLAAARDREVHVVVGSRMGDVKDMPPLRQWSNRTTSWWVSLLGSIDVKDSQSGYRLIKTEVIRKINLHSRRYDAESEILIKAGRAGFGVVEVPISTIYLGGKSSINPVLDTLRFARLILLSLFTS